MPQNAPVKRPGSEATDKWNEGISPRLIIGAKNSRKKTGCTMMMPMDRDGKKAMGARPPPPYLLTPNTELPFWKHVMGTIKLPFKRPHAIAHVYPVTLLLPCAEES